MNSLRRNALWKNLLMALLLASALGMIALAVTERPGQRLHSLPQLVHDTLKSFAGAI
jgi:hypothetical protein